MFYTHNCEYDKFEPIMNYLFKCYMPKNEFHI